MVIKYCRKFISKNNISTREKKVDLKFYIKSKTYQEDESQFAKKSIHSIQKIKSIQKYEIFLKQV